MILHFVGGKTAEITKEKEGRIWDCYYCSSNRMRYRVNKLTGEVQDNTYHNKINGLYVTEE